ncbi:transposase [Solibacillus sp. FSL H8-0538]|uniref:transposase n=1 Tax=Solibacillus sp. FSL H8-0538 TaxID=2921400 RepID=UPI0030FA88CB
MTKYTSELKLLLVKQYLNGNEGFTNLSKEVNISASKLHYWVQKYQYHGEKAFEKSMKKDNQKQSRIFAINEGYHFSEKLIPNLDRYMG